jgi:hypothetical protein
VYVSVNVSVRVRKHVYLPVCKCMSIACMYVIVSMCPCVLIKLGNYVNMCAYLDVCNADGHVDLKCGSGSKGDEGRAV